MELSLAVSRVKVNAELSKRLEGKFFCSALAVMHDFNVEAWELSYYDKEQNKISQISVGEDAVFKTEGAPFKNTELVPIDPETLNISSLEAIEIGKKHYIDKYKNAPYSKIFFSLHGGKNPVWSLCVVTKHLVIVQINIDSSSGDILKSDTHSLFDKAAAENIKKKAKEMHKSGNSAS